MNKVMLVTGGSRGIGAATVRLGAKRGYAVAINYQKRADVAQNLMDEINDGGGEGDHHSSECECRIRDH